MRRTKEKYTMNHPQLFPQGTVVEFLDFQDRFHSKSFQGQHVVDHVARNGPRSYVLVTKTPSPVGEGHFVCMNLQHDIRIVKRGDGPVRVFDGDDWVRDPVARHKHIWEDRLRVHSDPSSVPGPKGKGELFLGRVWIYERTVLLITFGLLSDYTVLDESKFTVWFNSIQSMFRFRPVPGLQDDMYVTVSKKRLMRSLRQNINRMLMNKSAVEKMETEKYMDDLDSDDDSSYNEGAGNEAFEITNEHGFPQMVINDATPNGTRLIPVCKWCGERTDENRGQGMICDLCQREDARDLDLLDHD